MATTRTIQTYPFTELPPSAQRAVIERRQRWAAEEFSDFADDCVLEDAATIAGLLGIEIEERSYKTVGGQTRTEPAIYYSGFSSQGDGCSFAGTWRAKAGILAAVQGHAPVDTNLHTIAAALDAYATQYPGCVAIVTRISHHYSHEYTVALESAVQYDAADNETELTEAQAKPIEETLRSFMRWIYRQLEQEYDYRTSDETCRAEAAEDTDTEYTADGEVWT